MDEWTLVKSEPAAPTTPDEWQQVGFWQNLLQKSRPAPLGLPIPIPQGMVDRFKSDWSPTNIVGGIIKLAQPRQLFRDIVGASDAQAVMAQQRMQDMKRDPTMLGKAKALAAAVGHETASFLPVVGPIADSLIQTAKTGDIPGAIMGAVDVGATPAMVGTVEKTTGLATLPEKMAQTGLGLTNATKKAFPRTNFGKTMLEKNIYTAGAAQRGIDALEGGIQADAQSLPLAGIDPNVIAQAAVEHAFTRSGADVRNASQADKIAAINNNYIAFRDANRVGNTMRYLSPSEALNLKRVSGNEGYWTQAVNNDPTRVGEFWRQGESLGARQALEDVFQNAGKESIVDRLRQQQDMMGLLDAMQNRSPGKLGRIVEIERTLNDPAKGLALAGILEGLRNPVVTGGLGKSMQYAMDPRLFQAIMMRNNMYGDQ